MNRIRTRGADRARRARSRWRRACSPPAPAAGRTAAERRTGGTLTIGLAEDPDALDPTLARTFVGRMVFLHMCEKLYDLNARLEIVPQLAAALPQLSSDKKTMTIRIRRGVRFNDGTPMNAQAVKTSLDRHRTLRGSARASEISPYPSVDVVGPLHGAAAGSTRRVLAADGAARRPGRDDHVAEADRGARRPVRDQPRLRRAVQVRQPRRPATGSRSRSRTFYYARSKVKLEPDRLPDHHRHRRTRREPPLGRHRGARPHRVDRPAGDPAGPEPARHEGDLDRLPGDLDQHREQERDREAVRERRHAARRRSSCCARRSSSRSTAR